MRGGGVATYWNTKNALCHVIFIAVAANTSVWEPCCLGGFGKGCGGGNGCWPSPCQCGLAANLPNSPKKMAAEYLIYYEC
jgi:hypothetical protein